MSERRKDPREKKCGICGKDLYAGEDWAYKRRPGRGDKTVWFCSYKCMRAFDAKHEKKQARTAGLQADLNATEPKEPVSRAVLAKALVKEIQRGGSVIAYMKAEGYKNPWEAYNAVRHYCETKMPELAEVLKPLKELPKGPPAQTGRPRKHPAKVEKVDKVPPVEEKLEPVQCIAHVDPADIAEALEAENTILKHEPMIPKMYTRDEILRIVDKAALQCQEETRLITMSSSGVKAALLQNSIVAAENMGVMNMRKQIRKILDAEEKE